MPDPIDLRPRQMHLDPDCAQRVPGEPIATTYDVAAHGAALGLSPCRDCAGSP